MTFDQHHAAAAAQSARQIYMRREEETTYAFVEAGAGVDDALLDLLDEALTSAPPGESVFVLIERKPSSKPAPSQPNGAGIPKPFPMPPPPPKPKKK